MEGGTEMSTMSTMSTMEGSQMSTLNAGDSGQESSRMVIFLGTCCLCMMVGLVGYVVLGSSESGQEPTDEVDSGGSDADGPSPPSYVSGTTKAPAKKTTRKAKTTTIVVPPLVTSTSAPTTRATTTTKKTTTTTTTTTTKKTTKTTTTKKTTKATTTKKTTKTTTTKKTTKTTTTKKTTTTTKAPFSVREMVCTVGAKAMSGYMIPPDGLCTYVYYSDVVVYAKALRGAEFDTSWQAFKNEIKSRKKTMGGISFDIKYVTANQFDNDVISHMKHLANNNMKHYGLLTTVTRIDKFPTLMSKAKNVLDKFKNIQGNDRHRKAVIAIGIYDFNTKNAYKNLYAQFRYAVEHTKADTVIALSSTGWQESEYDCYAAPPSAYAAEAMYPEPMKGLSKRYPDIKTLAGNLMARNNTYRRNVTLGLSFELGTMLYKMAKSNPKLDQSPFQKCTLFSTNPMDVVYCKDSTAIYKLKGHVQVGHIPRDKDFVYFWETTDTLRGKFDDLKRQFDMRPAMSWMVNNVHLSDFTPDSKLRCEEPFSRLKYIKERLFNLP